MYTRIEIDHHDGSSRGAPTQQARDAGRSEAVESDGLLRMNRKGLCVYIEPLDVAQMRHDTHESCMCSWAQSPPSQCYWARCGDVCAGFESPSALRFSKT